jgi:hypothetical protein
MSTRESYARALNSTNGRSFSPGIRALRAGFAILSAVAPPLAERLATRLFFTPHRRVRREPGAVAGATGTPFTVSVGGVKVACWSYGRGPTVLLVHGWGGSSRDWEALAPRLVAAGYRAILFDGPAHGVSGGRRTTLPEMVRAIHAIADEVALGPGGRWGTAACSAPARCSTWWSRTSGARRLPRRGRSRRCVASRPAGVASQNVTRLRS